MFLSWRRWMNQYSQRPRSKFRKPRRANSYRILVEHLESRFLPSTFTVRIDRDSGPETLRDAIMKVNQDPNPGTDTINFAIGIGQKTIALKSALPTITHP